MSLKYIDIVDDVLEYDKDFTYIVSYNGKGLRTAGCGCCSDDKLVTPENLAEAITDTETFLNELKQLRDKL